MFEINFVHWLVILSALISIGGAYAYIRDTLALDLNVILAFAVYRKRINVTGLK